MEIISYYLFGILVCWLAVLLYLTVNTRKIAFLREQTPIINEPSIAVIIAVRDEEAELQTALTSICELNYSAIQVIVVDDRSRDQSAQIINNLSEKYPQIKLQSVAALPPGWLGKTHALHVGYQKATAAWLLFTDADVVFQPEALKKAINYAIEKDLDHLTILPEVKSRSQWLNGILFTFQLMLEIKLRPWLASNRRSSASIGVGAFNLVRKTAYEQIGGHQSIKMMPDDDLQLARAIKMHGLKQDVLYGEDQLQLEWYPSVAEFIKGLMKNIFSAFDFKIIPAVSAAFATFIFFVLPVPLGLLSGNIKLIMLALMILIVQLILSIIKVGNRAEWWHGLLTTIGGAIMVFIVFKGMFLTLKNKGIYWRDSFYRLEELKANR